MDIKEIKKELGKDWSGYQNVLVSALNSKNAFVSKLNRYLIENSGKQLRPILSLLVAKACGGTNELTGYCAAVAEMIHTATLLHDDVADDGDLRRGVPTVKAVFGQAASVLAGDYWLARALDILSTCHQEILGCYTAAVQELAEGELIQMEKAELLDTTIEDYYSIIAKKTASLFIAATKSAVLSIDAPKEYVNAIVGYAYELGVAFQIRDDIFDYTPNFDTGKIAGADIKERKITLPLLCAMERASDSEVAIVREQLSMIENSIVKNGEPTASGNEQQVIDSINAFVYKHNGVQRAQSLLEEHSRKAITYLKLLPESKAKERLIQLAEFVGIREK